MKKNSILGQLDWWLVILYLTLVIMGWINIYAAVYNEEHKSIFDLSQSYGKQLLWIAGAFLIAFFIMIIEPKFYSAFAIPIYFTIIGLLLAVFVVGKEVAGSKSWFVIGEFRLQPAELAKFATSLALAKYLGRIDIRMEDLKTKIIAAILIAFPALLILMQNDTGSAIVFVAFIFVLYREGLSGNILIIGILIVFLFFLSLLIDKLILIGTAIAVSAALLFFIKRNRRNILSLLGLLLLVSGFIFSVDYVFHKVLEPHQKTRINVLLGKEIDLKGAGYNVNQSKIAIGSGGLTGKGFLQGTQTKYNFVPEQSTDFIFCTVGEEWGFLGSSLVIILFLFLLFRIINIAERQRSAFSRIYGYGVASVFFFHVTINIGMTLGIVPVVGIPLPFFSYGGSSLWAFTILLFIFIKLDSQRLQLV